MGTDAELPAPETSPEALLAKAKAAGQQASAAGQTLADKAAAQDIDDRALITQTVMWAFKYSFPAAVVVIVVLAFLPQTGAKDAIAGIIDILKSFLLPVVTLVLGYYFGRGKA